MASEAVTLDSIIARSDGLVSSRINEELILMSIEGGNYFGFDKILTDIWNQIVDPISVSTLIDQLLQHYDVERSVCETDILEVLNKMVGSELIVLK